MIFFIWSYRKIDAILSIYCSMSFTSENTQKASSKLIPQSMQQQPSSSNSSLSPGTSTTHRRTEPYDISWCRRKRFPTANVVRLLQQRELGLRPAGSHFIRGSREFYHAIRLQRAEHHTVTISSGTLPPYPQQQQQFFFPLRFTPDGSKLVAIGPDFQEIHIFTYRGCQFAANCQQPSLLFKKIFPHRTVVQFWDPRNVRCPERLQFGSLSRDCAIVSPDSAFLVVAASFMLNESHALFHGIVQNNESLPPSARLQHITFYSIDLKKGQLVDKCKFAFDQIDMLTGVYQQDWTLAILSTQHQTIHMLAICKRTGQLIRLKQLGPSLLDDDPFFQGTGPSAGTDGLDEMFTAFRQAFLTFLYKDHVRRGQVQKFLYEMDVYKNLKMVKLQFLGPELLLIRMDLHANRHTNLLIGSPYFMFVLLDWRRGRIAGVFHRTSEALFSAWERHNECFRNGHAGTGHFPNSMEHSQQARDQHRQAMESHLQVFTAEETRRRFLAQLPVPNNQFLVASPYLDPELFQFDEKQFDLVRKGRWPAELKLRLFSRRTNTGHSKLDFSSEVPALAACFLRILFHPTDPFVFSMRKDSQLDPLIYFHMPKSAEKDL